MSFATQESDSFNARHLSPLEIAKNFVAPPHFFQMIGLNHCVLLGPRGSGKTTLLKMLQPDASVEIESSLNGTQIPFIGVFVPADVRWAKQLTNQVAGITDANTVEQLFKVAFCTSALLSLVDTIDKCIQLAQQPGANKFSHFGFLGQRENESTLANRLSDLLHTPISVPSLSELKHKLRLRQTRFPSWALKIKGGMTISQLAIEDEYLSLSWLDLVVTAIETINEFIDTPNQRWALLLDELEIVPSCLLDSIKVCLRSTSSNLILKLALSPSASNTFLSIDEDDPTQGNDYSVINLWYTDKKDLRLFAGQLLLQALRRKGIKVTEDSFPSLLGRSSVYDNNIMEDEIEDESYSEANGLTSPESSDASLVRRFQLFSELSKKDASFSDFLTRSKINLSDLDSSDKRAQGPLIRKILPLVQFRNRALKTWNEKKATLKSGRVGYEPYFGVPNLLDITEGNPRWVLNLADLLDAERRNKGLKLSAASVQTAVVESMHQRFAAMLKVYPVGSSSSGNITTLYEFIKLLASSIRKQIYYEPFGADPGLSFEIDKNAIELYGPFLDTAIHLGALVIMNPDSSKRSLDSLQSNGLVGARVRLCFRIAPEFFLPLRSTGRRKISFITRPPEEVASPSVPQKRKKAITPSESPIQGTLF